MKTIHTISPELTKFLKSKNVYSKFVKNANASFWNDNLNPKTFDNISCAFDWELSNEGWNYWNKLNDEFKELKINKIK